MERKMATEHLLFEDVTYEVEARWDMWDTGVLVYQVGVVFKQARNSAMAPLRVREHGDNPRQAILKLIMLINDLRLDGVLHTSEQHPGLYFNAEVEVPHVLRDRVLA